MDDRNMVLHLVNMPDVVFEKILGYLTYDTLSKLRIVCCRFNDGCQRLLNRGFYAAVQYHAKSFKEVKSQLPRRESQRPNHPLARHNNILNAIETRLSLLKMTYCKYIHFNVCCFIPGKVIDELFRVLHLVNSTTSCLIPHEVLTELRDISSMAMDYFEEKIVPTLRNPNLPSPTRSSHGHLLSNTPTPSTSSSSSHSGPFSALNVSLAQCYGDYEPHAEGGAQGEIPASPSSPMIVGGAAGFFPFSDDLLGREMRSAVDLLLPACEQGPRPSALPPTQLVPVPSDTLRALLQSLKQAGEKRARTDRQVAAMQTKLISVCRKVQEQERTISEQTRLLSEHAARFTHQNTRINQIVNSSVTAEVFDAENCDLSFLSISDWDYDDDDKCDEDACCSGSVSCDADVASETTGGACVVDGDCAGKVGQGKAIHLADHDDGNKKKKLKSSGDKDLLGALDVQGCKRIKSSDDEDVDSPVEKRFKIGSSASVDQDTSSITQRSHSGRCKSSGRSSNLALINAIESLLDTEEDGCFNPDSNSVMQHCSEKTSLLGLSSIDVSDDVLLKQPSTSDSKSRCRNNPASTPGLKTEASKSEDKIARSLRTLLAALYKKAGRNISSSARMSLSGRMNTTLSSVIDKTGTFASPPSVSLNSDMPASSFSNSMNSYTAASSTVSLNGEDENTKLKGNDASWLSADHEGGVETTCDTEENYKDLMSCYTPFRPTTNRRVSSHLPLLKTSDGRIIIIKNYNNSNKTAVDSNNVIKINPAVTASGFRLRRLKRLQRSSTPGRERRPLVDGSTRCLRRTDQKERASEDGTASAAAGLMSNAAAEDAAAAETAGSSAVNV